ncbi:DUF4097 family beta strand repeat-containing protein [Catenuloplanes indicus]|uniref:DUF4097 domain-containing protein n=1 Tax=Catenuloplanes indicus TaxID=137267 RepID=A0AAE3W3K5_9ACTN|nr:DUF4097 family beta strand repeat-containing protein [Catenuloplanes indicus]MDQ0368705.1 hypothetical protein [Catenuloplanes indicus]
MASWTIHEPSKITCAADVRRLEVSLLVGRLTVIGADGPARIEVSKVGGRAVQVELEGGVLRVRQEGGSAWLGLLSWIMQLAKRIAVDVSIAVPPASRVTLGLISGRVIASGLRERTDVDVTAGSITLMGVGGLTRANLVSGPVEAVGVAGELIMDTVSGELILADSPVTTVRGTTVSGSITCDLDGAADSDIRLDTTSGSITARVPEDSDLAIELRALAGQVTSSFPEELAERTTLSGSTVNGWLGQGTGRLSASAISGSIALLSRPAVAAEDADPNDEPAVAGPVRRDPAEGSA